MIITPACGLARFDQRSAVNALRAVRKAADLVTDQLAD
jgi:methionine synthase II (cobalamin-independent)